MFTRRYLARLVRDEEAVQRLLVSLAATRRTVEQLRAHDGDKSLEQALCGVVRATRDTLERLGVGFN